MRNKIKFLLINPVAVILLVCVVSVFFNLYILDGIPGKALYLYIYGIFVFSLTCALFVLCLNSFSVAGEKLNDYFEPPRSVICVYWFFSFVSLVLSLYRIYTIGVHGHLGSFFLNLRYEASFGDGSSYGAQHFALFSLGLSLYYGYKGKLSKCFLPSLIFVISALSLAERTSIFFIFIAVFYLLYYRGFVKIKTILLFFSTMILLFVIIAVGAGKTSGNNSYDFIFNYIGYGITALSEYVYGREFEGCGRLIFGSVYGLLPFDSSGCNSTNDLFQVYDRFNVYTYVASPYLFGGWLGVTVSMMFFGGGYALLWHLAFVKGRYFLVLLSCYMYPVCMVFYAWQFSLTTYLYLFFILAPLFLKIRILSR